MKLLTRVLLYITIVAAVLITVAVALHIEYERDYKPYLEQYLDE